MEIDGKPMRVKVAVDGEPTRGVYDDMKTAATTAFTGTEQVFNRRFLVMPLHSRVDGLLADGRPENGRR